MSEGRPTGHIGRSGQALPDDSPIEYVLRDVEGLGDVPVGLADIYPAETAWFPDQGVLVVDQTLPTLAALAAIGRWAENQMGPHPLEGRRWPSNFGPLQNPLIS